MMNFNFFSLNIGFNFGMNNWFSPMSSCLGNFANFNMCSLFTNPFITQSFPTFNFNFDNIWNNASFNSSNTNIFSGGNCGSIWNNVNFNSGWNNDFSWNSNVTGTSKKREVTETPQPEKIKPADYKPISLDGYNAEKGKKLAKAAWDGRNKTKVWKNGRLTDFIGYCCRYVKTALQNTGLAPYYEGHAYQMLANLKQNKNFKEIAVSGDNYKHLPAGCILVYDKGVSNYDKDYGHIEVIAENGKGVSDGVTSNIRKPSAIFMPV